MSQFLAYGIIGLSTAAIYAVIGSGLVLTYTTTGVFNFAHGAAGMLAAFTYWQLTIGWGWPVPVALAVVLLVAAPVFGLLVERVVIRPVQGPSGPGTRTLSGRCRRSSPGQRRCPSGPPRSPGSRSSR
jgi:branched-chain amino acid transport system permease protein